MKKKLISSLLAAALTLSLAACGSAPAASGSEAASEPAVSSDTAASTESAAPTGDGFDASVDYAALAGTTITVAASPVPTPRSSPWRPTSLPRRTSRSM